MDMLANVSEHGHTDDWEFWLYLLILDQVAKINQFPRLCRLFYSIAVPLFTLDLLPVLIVASRDSGKPIIAISKSDSVLMTRNPIGLIADLVSRRAGMSVDFNDPRLASSYL